MRILGLLENVTQEKIMLKIAIVRFPVSLQFSFHCFWFSMLTVRMCSLLILCAILISFFLLFDSSSVLFTLQLRIAEIRISNFFFAPHSYVFPFFMLSLSMCRMVCKQRGALLSLFTFHFSWTQRLVKEITHIITCFEFGFILLKHYNNFPISNIYLIVRVR